MGHTSVLLHEAIDGLDIHSGDCILDGTLGSGGHSEEIIKRFGTSVRIIGLDMDEDALMRTKERFAHTDAQIDYVQANFRNLDTALHGLQISQVNKILLDIGLSSNQFEESGRGFSFQKDEPLKMTFKKNPTEEDVTAHTIVNEWNEETISTILWAYGEEKYSRKIAKAIVAARETKPIETTFELVDIITHATPARYHHMKIHPATRTFQALRVTVNDELQALQEGIKKGFEYLAPHGRMAVISFHSLEDRIVKNFFRDWAHEGKARLVTKKPIVPGEEEVQNNKRSRSAKLRILIKE